MTKKTETPAPSAPVTDPADVERMRSELGVLRRQNAELLAKMGAGAGATKEPEPERPAVLPTRKLLFVGTVRDPKTGHVQPDLRHHEVHGFNHTTGRSASPTMFKASAEDGRPHAFVHQSLGDWLIANDRQFDAYGNPQASRYEWAEPLAPVPEG